MFGTGFRRRVAVTRVKATGSGPVPERRCSRSAIKTPPDGAPREREWDEYGVGSEGGDKYLPIPGAWDPRRRPNHHRHARLRGDDGRGGGGDRDGIR
jgi:hypothetical protein